jgi:hypothetical protein
MKRHWLLLALSIASLSAGAADMYSWTDANGVKHFSDSPPPANAKAQKLKVKGGVTTTSATDAPAENKNKTNGGPELAAAAGYSATDIQRNCEIAQRNLSILEEQKPDPGSDAEKTHAAQVEKAHQQMKLFCSGS